MEYENYSETSKKYDNFRRPIGLESLNGALKLASETLGKPVNELTLLDVGCGTGNYIGEIKDKVAKCHGLEFNEGMYAQACEKFKGDDQVSLKQGNVLDMKEHFEENSFDVVIMTQVMHHLTPDTHDQALSEISRVLRPGGTFWMSTCTPQ